MKKNVKSIDIPLMNSTARQFLIVAKVMSPFRKVDNENHFMPFFTVMVNSALSAEIYLKMIIYFERNIIPGEHNLSKLFSQLSANSKKHILEILEKKYNYTKNEISQNIEIFSNAFVKFRYIYEIDKNTISSVIANINFSLKFPTACAEVVAMFDPTLNITRDLPDEFKWIDQ